MGLTFFLSIFLVYMFWFVVVFGLILYVWLENSSQSSHLRRNVRPLRIRTEKDALNVRLEGPKGRTKKAPGYGVFSP